VVGHVSLLNYDALTGQKGYAISVASVMSGMKSHGSGALIPLRDSDQVPKTSRNGRLKIRLLILRRLRLA
jgi:hypothetical protein